MEIKRYKARTVHEAVAKIKQELGQDAMILSTKKIPVNPRNPYKCEMYEVTAADNIALSEHKTLNIQHKANKYNMENDSGCYRTQDIFPKIDKTDYYSVLKDELVSIKDMLFLLNKTKCIIDLSKLNPICINIYSQLVKAGISETQIKIFMEKSGAFETNQSLNADEIKKNMIQQIISSISVFDPFQPDGNNQHIEAFIGPTGVGKTTTIAKIAAELSLKQKKKTGIISIDSYRIGAVEQLKTYASIMALPCMPAFSIQDLELIIKKMQHMDVILIDTAGQSQHDEGRIKELHRFLLNKLSIRCHLVLSANTKVQDLKTAADNFGMIDPKTYIFTKIDETQNCGNIIDQTQNYKLPISFITNGQKVPEDIMLATKKNILQLILN